MAKLKDSDYHYDSGLDLEAASKSNAKSMTKFILKLHSKEI